jgi:hypothetical protein
MTRAREDVQAFLDDVAESPHLWNTIDLRVLALFVEGQWHNLSARCVLEPHPPDQVRTPAYLPRTPDIAVLHAVHSIDDLPMLTESVQAGILGLDGHEIRFVQSNHERHLVGPYEKSFHSRAGSLAGEVHGPFLRGHLLSLRGGGTSDIFSRYPRGLEGLNHRLRTLKHPWDGLHALSRHGLGSVHGVSREMSCTISFIAPLEATLVDHECALANGVLRFSLLAGSVAARENCVLGIFGRSHSGAIISRTLRLHRRRWRRDPHGYRYEATVTLKEAAHLTLMLHVANHDVGNLHLYDRSGALPVLLVASQALIPEARKFEQYLLNPDSSESREFERAVTRLLTLCGFQVDAVGDAPKTSNTVDALVLSPDGSTLLTVECTTGSLHNDGKLGKLVRRTVQVREALTDMAVSVFPLMVSSWSNLEASSSEVEAADADGVRVLWSEDLEELLALALNDATVEEIFERVLASSAD